MSHWSEIKIIFVILPWFFALDLHGKAKRKLVANVISDGPKTIVIRYLQARLKASKIVKKCVSKTWTKSLQNIISVKCSDVDLPI